MLRICKMTKLSWKNKTYPNGCLSKAPFRGAPTFMADAEVWQGKQMWPWQLSPSVILILDNLDSVWLTWFVNATIHTKNLLQETGEYNTEVGNIYGKKKYIFCYKLMPRMVKLWGKYVVKTKIWKFLRKYLCFLPKIYWLWPVSRKLHFFCDIAYVL